MSTPCDFPEGLRKTNLSVLIASGLGFGFLPMAPGTWGSLVALPLAWSAWAVAGRWGVLVAAAIIFAAGTVAVGSALRNSNVRDPSWVVIDEIAAQCLVLAPFLPDPMTYGLGFILFRAADILKPWPAFWIDRHMTGAFGAMLDDLVAALYALILLFPAMEYLR